ncbi:hypothetical protein WKW80_34220 [Variovorax humicola]|uniref:Uncharacterized protein n=1 Tax=Variovorax humicola TaxID=1769758 RepID=A0ABU8WBW8_9BURK
MNRTIHRPGMRHGLLVAAIWAGAAALASAVAGLVLYTWVLLVTLD